jgi:hypothetical protein
MSLVLTGVASGICSLSAAGTWLKSAALAKLMASAC